VSHSTDLEAKVSRNPRATLIVEIVTAVLLIFGPIALAASEVARPPLDSPSAGYVADTAVCAEAQG
jgi:hypothetical protein